MSQPRNRTTSSTPENPSGSRLVVWLVLGSAVVLALALLLPRAGTGPRTGQARPVDGAASGESQAAGTSGAGGGGGVTRPRFGKERLGPGSTDAAARVVAEKVSAFARSRRALAESYAQHLGVTVPPSVDEFFTAVEGGDWREVKGLFGTLSAQREAGDSGLQALWPALREAYAVAEQAQVWPAQELLAYGRTILGSMPPGAIYVASGDAQGVIPSLVAETGGGAARPVTLSAESLADPSYLKYLGFVTGDRVAVPGMGDSEAALQAAAEDALRRAEHDRQFPNEAKQLRPGEEVREEGGRVVVSGRGMVEAVNQALLRSMLEKNPGVPITIADPAWAEALNLPAVPKGPVWEVVAGGGSAAETLTAANAADTLGFWKDTAARMQADAALPPESAARNAYARTAISQAAAFARNNLTAEAEQAYRVAREIAPASYEPMEQLTMFLVDAGRSEDAMGVLDEFIQQNEGQRYVAEELRKKLTGEGRAGRR